MQEYNLHKLIQNDYIYIEVRKGMYGLPQAGILANNLLKERLATVGYCPTRHTPGLWRHKWRQVTFSLVVDDFGIKYVGKENVLHLLNTLKQWYEVAEDWSGGRYCGMTLNWNYEARYVNISMPGYIHAALHKYQHQPHKAPQYSPHAHPKPQYGAKVQMTEEVDTSPTFPQPEIKRIQGIVGTLLFMHSW